MAIPATTKSSDDETDQKLVIGISSRALFDLEKEDAIFRQSGLKAYEKYQIEHEDSPVGQGAYFNLVRKLLNLNRITQQDFVEVILLSRNNANVCLRIFNSINYHKLDIKRSAFCTGQSPHKYAKDFNCSLFLSGEAKDVSDANEYGIAAGLLIPPLKNQKTTAPEINGHDESMVVRFAFDIDSVVVSNEADQVYQKSGKEGFIQSEQNNAHNPLGKGPFHGFLSVLQGLQCRLRAHNRENAIRIALITARDMDAHERVIRTLRKRDIHVDEVLFLGGREKGPFVRSYGADIFFDDHEPNCSSAVNNQIPSSRVLYPSTES